MALASERSVFLTHSISDHTATNMWLAQEILGVEFETRRVGQLYRVEKQAS
jgi:RNA 3'-terminal phosphate cyclase